MNFSRVQNFSLKRSPTSYSIVQKLVISPIIRNREFLINRTSIAKKSYLNIGCGPHPHSDFVNLDYVWNPLIDICWDISKKIPLSSESMGGIYSEHCLEHVPLNIVDFVLSECLRILKPGGTIRISVPDGELYLRDYLKIMDGDLSIKLPYSETDSYEGIYAPIMSINRVFRACNHLFIYDCDMLKKLLQKNNFQDIHKESYRTGRDQKLLIDREFRKVESLYIEATKPD